MQLQNGAPLSPPIPALYNSNNLLLNSTTPSTQQHVLASLLPTLPVAVPEDYSQAIHDHAEVLQEVQNEKADIDGRTTALEVAIAKLMQGLPVETRDALGSGGDAALGGVGGSQGTGAGLGEGLDWDPAVGGAPTSDIDLDNFLAQYCMSFPPPPPSEADMIQRTKRAQIIRTSLIQLRRSLRSSRMHFLHTPRYQK